MERSKIMLENKKILMVGKETYTYPFYYLSQKWKDNNNLAMFWINPIESEYDECDINSSTYFAFEKLGYVKNYTLNKAANLYTANIKNVSLDYEYLEYLEKTYTHFKNLNIQLISDQKMTAHYHYRTMCVPITYEQQLLWIQLVYKDIEIMLEEFKPDVIFDCDIAELARTALNEVAYHRHIPYISIAYPKYEMYKIPSFQLSVDIDNYFIKEYEKCLKHSNDEECAYIEQCRKNSSLKNKMYLNVNDATYQYDAEPFMDTIKTILGSAIYFFKQDLSKRNRELKRKNPILYDGSYKYMKFWIKCRLFRRKLMTDKRYFDYPQKGEKYVYMPLHLIPESTTFSVAPFWINELTIIEALSKSLPAGWYLYVKEHQAMLGERGEEFYKKVKRIPNVKFVQYNYYKDPKPWIEKAEAVVSITGTAVYEAALLGIPGFLLGNTPFGIIKGITRVKNIEDFPELFRTLKKKDNIKELAAYIKAVKNVGTPINLLYIMDAAYNHLVRGTEFESNFWKEIDNLQLFFEKSFEYDNN